jgi:type VI secretion system protein ImpB
MARNRSFQNEIPPSRVNIRYVKFTDGAQEQIELPLKLLLLGDYTFREDDTPLNERKKIAITQGTFESVMREQGLKLSMVVPNRLTDGEGDEIKVELDIDSLKSFTPDEIVKNVPELARMIELRELLTDLKARVITNRKFRLALEGIVKDQQMVESIMQELERIAPPPEDGIGE